MRMHRDSHSARIRSGRSFAAAIILGCALVGSAAAQSAGKPATWIADRAIKGWAFIDDLGASLPDDQIKNDVAQRIKELTGITLEWRYTAGSSDKDMLMTALAAGDLPDVIVHYLDDSSRPEFPIVLKAAREGMFVDLAPYLKKTKVYSKYFQADYLPVDTAKNVVFRPEFKGAVYMVHINIARTNGSNDMNYRSGMYIQKSIADALKINPAAIKTEDDLYNLLKKIKAGNFKDNNGNPVYPVGPAMWGSGGGKVYPSIVNNYSFAQKTGDYDFGLIDGKLFHEAETPYAKKQVAFYRKLLAEGLIHPELFTMDGARAEEGVRSNSFAIIADAHNYLDFLEQSMYLPVGPLYDIGGSDVDYRVGKSGNCAWEIPAGTKHPEDIVKFADFLASKEGKLLWMYGIEGKHYDMVGGKPVPRKEIVELKNKDRKASNNLNIYMGYDGSLWGWALGSTDIDNVKDFGELKYGMASDTKTYQRITALANFGYEKKPQKIVWRASFVPKSFLSDFPRQNELKPLLDQYKDFQVKAIFAKTAAEADKVMDNYGDLLNKAGLAEYKAMVMKLYKDDPKQLFIKSYKTSELMK